eukprot:20073-Prymnesium_polylepis.1
MCIRDRRAPQPSPNVIGPCTLRWLPIHPAARLPLGPGARNRADRVRAAGRPRHAARVVRAAPRGVGREPGGAAGAAALRAVARR